MATTQHRPKPDPRKVPDDRDDEETDLPEPEDGDDDDEPEPRRGSSRGNYRKGVLTKRFTLPPGCTDKHGNPVETVVVRELDGNDEIQAALWMEANAKPEALESMAGAMAAEQRELVRISLVEVNDDPVNLDGVPWMGMDEWTIKTFRAVRMYYVNVNTFDDSAMRKSLAGAEVVSGAAPASGRGSARRAG